MITAHTYMIICPLVFLAGFVDAIGGGGGLISLPAYLIAGLPAHRAIATNKMSSTCGTTLTTMRFARQKLIDWKMAAPAMAAAVIGSYIGAHLSLLVDTRVLTRLLYVILPVTAVIVLRKNVLKDRAPESGSDDRDEAGPSGHRLTLLTAVIAFVIGIYDGFYGPGTGTFLIIAFSLFARMDVRSANGFCKAINMTTNVTSLVVFLQSGQVLIQLGIAAALCNMAGNWIGSGMALKAGARITRPVILMVLLLLFVRIVTG